LTANTPIATKAIIDGAPTNEIKFEGTSFPTGSNPAVEYRGVKAHAITSHTDTEVVAYFLHGVPLSINEDGAKPTLSFTDGNSMVVAAEAAEFAVEGSALLNI
jgi:threonine synthase